MHQMHPRPRPTLSLRPFTKLQIVKCFQNDQRVYQLIFFFLDKYNNIKYTATAEQAAGSKKKKIKKIE
jgi:hypothetical protein